MRILTFQHKDSAVYNYRMDRPLVKGLGAKKRRSFLRKNEKLQIGELAKRLKRIADVWVIKYIDQRHTLDVLYTMRNHIGSKVVVDIDDNVWQIPAGNIARGDLKTFSNRAIMMAESVKCADYVTVSTEHLKTILTPLNENIAVLPNYIDPKEWKFKRKTHKKVRIGWVWSPTHIPDNAEVEEALKKIKAKYQDRIEIIIFGTEQNIFDFDTENIKAVRYDKYPKVFTEAGIDISIAPLADNEFNKSKSNIKWLESTMAGAAFIGSKVYPYEFSVKEGKTGYLAATPSQWFKRMSYLIETPSKRKELVENATKEILEKYSNGNVWREFYEKIAKQ